MCIMSRSSIPLMLKHLSTVHDYYTHYPLPGTIKPPSWGSEPYELDPMNPSNNAFLNEPFIVWMRVAAFPTFRKLYSRIDMSRNPELDNGLEAGTYRLVVEYRLVIIPLICHYYLKTLFYEFPRYLAKFALFHEF